MRVLLIDPPMQSIMQAISSVPAGAGEPCRETPPEKKSWKKGCGGLSPCPGTAAKVLSAVRINAAMPTRKVIFRHTTTNLLLP